MTVLADPDATVAAVLAGAAVVLVLPGRSGGAVRLRRVVRPLGASAPGRRTRRSAPPVGVAAAAAGVGAGVLLGGVSGLVVGLLVATAVVVSVRRLEPRAARERRMALMHQAPDVADLLAACLASGAPLGHAVDAVARAVGEPASGPLRSVVASLELGGDAVVAWRALAAEPGLSALGREIARSVDSGAPLGDVLPGIAEDLRRMSRVEAETAARAAGVRAVAPLAACFLPAFLLLGVVPVVASMAESLLYGS